jgi:transposase
VLGKQDRWQEHLFVACPLRDLIPDDHILKRVDKVLDLSWLREEVRDLYCADNGRPSIDPESAVRLMLAGFFQGTVQDRKLMREAQVNIAMRWFAGYQLHEKLPDHSSLTRIRQRWGEERFRRVFERTVEACLAAGLVNGETVHTDATLIRADVSWSAVREEYVERVLSENEPDDDPPPDQPRRGRPRTRPSGPEKKKVCTTDPDATLAKSSTPGIAEPSYKQHTTVDDQAGVVLDVAVTTGSAAEGEQLQKQIQRVEQRTGKTVKTVTADCGYGTASNYAVCEERGTDAVIPPPKKAPPRRGCIPTIRFKYDAKHDVVRCLRGRTLRRKGRAAGGWTYRPRAKDCKTCPLRTRCTTAKSGIRTILIVDHYPALLRARRRWLDRDASTRALYARHRWRAEGAHGEAKTQHSLRRATRRGLWNVAIQVYLTAAAMNLKRLASALLHALLARYVSRQASGRPDTRTRRYSGAFSCWEHFPPEHARRAA